MSKTAFGELVVAVALSAAIGAAVAAEPVGTIARIQGSAVVSQGAQYVVALEGMAIREGDRLMALEGGAVTIRFADGCQLTLRDNEVLTVGADAGCNYGVDPNSGIARGPNGGGYLRRAALEPPTPPALPPVAAIVPAGGAPSWLVPVLAMGAAAGGAIALSNDDDDNGQVFAPISPQPPISP